jgi:hypothetical protein
MPEYRNLGDALRGDRIAAQARQIDKVVINKRTHAHKGQFTTLRDNAFCIIEIPLKAVSDKK